MPLPVGVTTTTITFGPYTQAQGLADLVEAGGKLFPVDPSTNRAVRLVDIASGAVITSTPVQITVDEDGTASVAGIPHTGQATLSPTGWAWRVEWNIASRKPSPGNRTFVVDSGATADFDLLVPAATIPAVAISQPTVASVAGLTGAPSAAALVTAMDTPLRAAFAARDAFPVLAANYGVSASNSDNTAALNAAFTAAQNGTCILPPGTLQHSGALTADACNIVGAGMNATELSCTAQLGGTTPALTWTCSTGIIRHLRGFSMRGPTAASLGVKTANTWGLRLDQSVFLSDIVVSRFDAGVIMNSNYGHIYGSNLNITSNYYGLYWAKNNSDFAFRDSTFTGNTFASIATPSNVGMSSARFDRCHLGYGPYGVYQEAAPANQGSNKLFLQEVTFNDTRFEQIGNAAIWTDAQDDGSNYSQFADITIINPGFSWADGIAGGAPWATLTTKPASYAIRVTKTNRNIKIVSGPTPFLTGLTTPTIAASAATAGIFYANSAGHTSWVHIYSGTTSTTDLTVGSGTQNYMSGTYELPGSAAGLTLPRLTANKLTASGFIGRRDGGAPPNGTYVAGDWSVDFTTPGLWMTNVGGVNPAWVNLLQLAATAGVPAMNYVTGQYYGIPGPRTTSAANTNGSLTWFPFRCDSTHTFTGIACEVTSAGGTGAVVRLGLYADASGKPGTLVTDYGTIDATSTGRKAITGLTIALTPGWYWLAAVVQGTPTPVPTMRVAGATILEGAPIQNGVQSGGGWNESTSVTGALANAVTPGAAGSPIAVALLA